MDFLLYLKGEDINQNKHIFIITECGEVYIYNINKGNGQGGGVYKLRQELSWDDYLYLT